MRVVDLGGGQMALVTMKELLESGVHFGHQTRRWNPKMKRYIYHERNGIYIIDLHQTLRMLEDAFRFAREVAARGHSILFVGTKRQAEEALSQAATKCNCPYVNRRWLGGMMTNFTTMRERIAYMERLISARDNDEWSRLPKKEVLGLTKELEKLETNLGGIRHMTKVPGAIFIVDLKREHLAAAEANKLKIPVIAIVDTNCDPDQVDYVIPGNDDAIRAIRLVSTKMADAVNEGRQEFIARAAEKQAIAEEAAQAAADAKAAAQVIKVTPPEDDFIDVVEEVAPEA
jgi:small subunit ribosomal protein S2